MESGNSTDESVQLSEDRFSEWVSLLRRLYRPRGLIHVGPAPVGAVATYDGWDIEYVDFVEANESVVQILRDLVSRRPTWEVHCVVAAGANGKRNFFQTSLGREDSLLDEGDLRLIWRNIVVKDVSERDTQTLDSLISRPANWITVDCLPALEVLQGAVNHLANADVVIARTVVTESVHLPMGCAKTDLISWMNALGFDAIASTPERFRAVGKLLFARNWWREQNRTHAIVGVERDRAKGAENKVAQLERQMSVQLFESADEKLRSAELQQLLSESSAQLENLAAALAAADLRGREIESLLNAELSAKVILVENAAKQEAAIEILERRQQELTVMLNGETITRRESELNCETIRQQSLNLEKNLAGLQENLEATHAELNGLRMAANASRDAVSDLEHQRKT